MTTVLVLAPHADDGELGCGATVSKFVDEGKEIYTATFSIARASVKKGFPENVLDKELREASKVLNIPEDHVTVFDYPVRNFPEHRQTILDDLLHLRDKINPDIVFMPTSTDVHQDHQVIAHEGLRAFKRKTILAYDTPWNDITFESRTFVPVTKKHVERKVASLRCYVSQRHRDHLDESFTWSLAKVRGTQIGVEYAESFEVIRWVINDETAP